MLTFFILSGTPLNNPHGCATGSDFQLPNHVKAVPFRRNHGKSAYCYPQHPQAYVEQVSSACANEADSIHEMATSWSGRAGHWVVHDCGSEAPGLSPGTSSIGSNRAVWCSNGLAAMQLEWTGSHVPLNKNTITSRYVLGLYWCHWMRFVSIFGCAPVALKDCADPRDGVWKWGSPPHPPPPTPQRGCFCTAAYHAKK